MCDNPEVSMLDQIEDDLRAARLRRDQVALAALGMLKSEIVVASKAKGWTGGVDDALVVRVARSELKRREEAREAFAAAGRAELAEKEALEAEVLRRYVPAAMSDAELEAEVRAILTEVSPEGPGGFGAVMKVAAARLAGRAVGARIAQEVRRLLA